MFERWLNKTIGPYLVKLKIPPVGDRYPFETEGWIMGTNQNFRSKFSVIHEDIRGNGKLVPTALKVEVIDTTEYPWRLYTRHVWGYPSGKDDEPYFSLRYTIFNRPYLRTVSRFENCVMKNML